MKLEKLFSSLTPGGAVLCAASAIFLFSPEGLPFLNAGCASPGTAGQCINAVLQTATACVDDVSSTGAAFFWVQDATVQASLEKCELTASARLAISQAGCTPQWRVQCNFNCSGTPTAATGRFNGVVSKTVGCDGNNDNMRIFLEHDQNNCGSCTPLVVLDATGNCDSD
jgi:hypothetical protein